MVHGVHKIITKREQVNVRRCELNEFYRGLCESRVQAGGSV